MPALIGSPLGFFVLFFFLLGQQVHRSKPSSWQDNENISQSWMGWKNTSQLPAFQAIENFVQPLSKTATPVSTLFPCVSVATEVPHPMMSTGGRSLGSHRSVFPKTGSSGSHQAGGVWLLHRDLKSKNHWLLERNICLSAFYDIWVPHTAKGFNTGRMSPGSCSTPGKPVSVCWKGQGWFI